MDDPIITLFGIGIFGMLFFMILAAFQKHSPEKKAKLDELYKKQESARKELLEISIKQVIALNGMLENDAITLENYYVELNKVYQQCLRNGIDISILKQIKPGPIKSREEIIKKILNTSTVLHDTNQMDSEEYNRNINYALDQKNQKRFGEK